MTYKLWLDDDAHNPLTPPRHPPDASWKVAHTYDEAINLFEKFGWPHTVRFDHDLGDANAKTGADFAKFLVGQDLDNGGMPENFSYGVHSENIIGKGNIIGLLDQYISVKATRNEPGGQ